MQCARSRSDFVCMPRVRCFMALAAEASIACSDRVLAHAAPAPAMGSMDWGWCAWCWVWVEEPYMIDGLGALCETCDRNSLEGMRPPWQPDARARKAQWLRLFFDVGRLPPNSHPLPEVLLERLAEFLEFRCSP